MKIILDEKRIRKGKPIGLPYIGSKKKISKKLIEIIKQNFGTEKTVYDLFGGGGAVTFECLLNGLNVVYNDIDPIPGLMIQKILSEDREYLKTLICSREEFFQIRDKEEKVIDDHLKLLVNSFSNNNRDYLYSKKTSDIKYKLAKEIIEKYDCFYGYKQTETFKGFVENEEKQKSINWEHKHKKNQTLQQISRLQQISTLQQMERLGQLKSIKNNKKIKNLEIHSKNYKEFSDIKNSIIYLDPPYKNTKRAYNHNDLNYEEFFDWCRDMSKENIVLISGYDMPKDFECIYEFTKAKSTLQGGTHNGKYEKLYTTNN